MILKEYLEQENLTIDQFAKKIGYTREHIGRVMKGQEAVGPKLAKLVEYVTKGKVMRNEILTLSKEN